LFFLFQEGGTWFQCRMWLDKDSNDPRVERWCPRLPVLQKRSLLYDRPHRVPLLERLFNFNVFVYELKETEEGKVNAELVRRSPYKFDDTMNLNLYMDHFSYTKRGSSSRYRPLNSRKGSSVWSRYWWKYVLVGVSRFATGAPRCTARQRKKQRLSV
jgi:hypothetical protein